MDNLIRKIKLKELYVPKLVFFLIISTITVCFISVFFFYMPRYLLIFPPTISLLLWLIFGTVLGQLIIFIIGYTILYFLPKNKEFPNLVKFALSYGLGTGFLCLSMFICMWMGINLKFSYLPLLIIVLLLFFYFRIYKSLKNDISEIIKTIKNQKFNKIEYFCILILIIESIYLFLYWYLFPIYHYDDVHIWDFKAKAIYYEGNIDVLDRYGKKFYPLLVPLNLSFFYVLFMQPYHFSKILFVSYFYFLIIFFYYSLRFFKLNRTYSFLISTLLAIIGEVFDLATIAYGDLALTFFYTIGTIFIFYYFNTEKNYYLLYSSIFMGFMAWTKDEGIYLLISNVLILLLYHIFLLYKKKIKIRKVLRSIIILIIPGFIIYLPWLIYIIINNYYSEYLPYIFNIFNYQQTISDIYIIIWRSSIYIIGPVKWGIIFWFVFYIILLFNLKFLKKEKIFFLFLFCVIHYLLYIFVYIVTPHDLRIQIAQSYDRMLLHLTPICCYLIGILILNNEKMLLDFKEDSFHRYMFIIFGLVIIISMILILLFHNYFLSFLKENFPYYGIDEM